MPKFTVIVERNTRETCTIEIEAESQEAAEEIVSDAIGDDSDLEWAGVEFEECVYEVIPDSDIEWSE